MILDVKTAAIILQNMIDQVRDGVTIAIRESYLYTQGTDVYVLSGAIDATVSVIAIQSIEGIRADGFYAHPTQTFNSIAKWTEDTDFSLTASTPTSILTGSNTTNEGDALFDTLTWLQNKPRDGDRFYVTYTYFDTNKVVNLTRPTSFANNTIAQSMLNAFAVTLSNIYNELEDTHIQSNIATSTGEDLVLHGENYDIDKNDATKSTGSVTVTNNSGQQIQITSSWRFTTNQVNKKIFKATETKSIADGVSENIEAESVVAGVDQNVGVGTITLIFDDVSLNSQANGVSVTNLGVINGQTNLFNDGSNIESDINYRDRILNTINKKGNATKSAIEAAVNTLQEVSIARVYDWEDKKSISPPNFQVFVVGSTDKVIRDSTILTSVSTEVQAVKPVGSRSIITTPMGIHLDIVGIIDVNRNFWSERSSIQADVNTAITNYVNDLSVGQDVITSKIIKLASSVSNVENFRLTSIAYSEFAFHPFETESNFLVFDNVGRDIPYAQQFQKMPKGFNDVFLYSGVAVFTISGTNISSTITPTVYIAIQDDNGIWVRDPQYTIDWFSTNSPTTITINSGAGAGQSVELTSGTTNLLFAYESDDNHTIDGMRVLMSGTFTVAGDTLDVAVEVWSGASEPATKITTLSGSIDVASGTLEYTVNYDQHTFDTATSEHWLVISGTGSGSVTSGTAEAYVLFESSNRSAIGLPSTSFFSGATWVTKTGDKYMEVVSLNTNSAASGTIHNDVDVTNLSNFSEVAVLNTLTTTTSIYTGDEE